jgi:hypothetical protein
MKYEVTLSEFHTIIVEADSKEEAGETVGVMSEEEILEKSFKNSAMNIWNISEVADNE